MNAYYGYAMGAVGFMVIALLIAVVVAYINRPQ